MTDKPKHTNNRWTQKDQLKKRENLKPTSQGEVKTYYLSPEELEYYRALPRPINEATIRTIAKRYVKKSPKGY